MLRVKQAIWYWEKKELVSFHLKAKERRILSSIFSSTPKHILLANGNKKCHRLEKTIARGILASLNILFIFNAERNSTLDSFIKCLWIIINYNYCGKKFLFYFIEKN